MISPTIYTLASPYNHGCQTLHMYNKFLQAFSVSLWNNRVHLLMQHGWSSSQSQQTPPTGPYGVLSWYTVSIHNAYLVRDTLKFRMWAIFSLFSLIAFQKVQAPYHNVIGLYHQKPVVFDIKRPHPLIKSSLPCPSPFISSTQ